jgi:hypothetical protein
LALAPQLDKSFIDEKTAELAENVLIPLYASSTKTEIGKMSKSHQNLTRITSEYIDVMAV